MTPEHHPRICDFCQDDDHGLCDWAFGCECPCPWLLPLTVPQPREGT